MLDRNRAINADLMREYWSALPDALIGVPTGVKFVAVDVNLQYPEAQEFGRRTRQIPARTSPAAARVICYSGRARK